MVKAFEKVSYTKSAISCCDITLSPKDTLVIKFDQEFWDLESANQIAKNITQLYPNNKIITIFNGMELGVIYNED